MKGGWGLENLRQAKTPKRIPYGTPSLFEPSTPVQLPTEYKEKHARPGIAALRACKEYQLKSPRTVASKIANIVIKGNNNATPSTEDEGRLREFSPRCMTHGELARQLSLSFENKSTLELLARADCLVDYIRESDGAGMAAPQLGWNARVLAFNMYYFNGLGTEAEEALRYPNEVWYNPEVTHASAHTNWFWEGCFSVPGLVGWVERPAEVRVKYTDIQGEEKELSLEGSSARIFQHEFDHLDGVLFPQKTIHGKFILPVEAIRIKKRWKENWPSPGAYKTWLGEFSDVE